MTLTITLAMKHLLKLNTSVGNLALATAVEKLPVERFLNWNNQ